MLLALDEDAVLALEHVERLGAVPMDVEWRPEVRRLGRLEQRERPAAVSARRLDDHGEVAEVDLPALAGAKHDRLAESLHPNPSAHLHRERRIDAAIGPTDSSRVRDRDPELDLI